MQENKSELKIREELFSAHTTQVVEALNKIKGIGNVTYLPLLFEILLNKPEKEVEKEILFILNNLKAKEAVPVLTQALKNPDYLPIRKKLTCACWQNGLNFKNSLPLFIDLVIQEDWETGFEALTVIENMNEYPEQVVVDLEKEKITQALNAVSEQKKYFLQEILKLIG